MRHRYKTKTLHRDMGHRKALVKNLSDSLILNEAIVTTVTKAKYLRPYIEKLITKSKSENTFNNVKYLKTKLNDEGAIRKILEDIGPRNIKRAGGYTRIIKLPNRAGDNAQMARIELVEKPVKKEVKEKATLKETKKTTIKKGFKEKGKK